MVDQLTKWIVEARKAGTCLEVTAVGHQAQLFGQDPVQMLNIKSIKGEIMPMVTEVEYEAARKAAKEVKDDNA